MSFDIFPFSFKTEETMIKDDDVKEVKRRYIDDPSLNLFTGISSCIDVSIFSFFHQNTLVL